MKETTAFAARNSKATMNVPSLTQTLCEMCKYLLQRLLLGANVTSSVIGLSDGLTVPFALTAGLSSLGESKLVVLGGIAELIAGAISMGIGGFLASQAERDHYRYLRHQTSARLERNCVGEMEREVFGVLGPLGVDEPTCSAVAKCLIDAECNDERVGGRGVSAIRNVDEEEGTAALKWSKEVGLTAFLMKFAEGVGTSSIPVLLLYIADMFFLQRTSQSAAVIRLR
jgi:hypothetical protein